MLYFCAVLMHMLLVLCACVYVACGHVTEKCSVACSLVLFFIFILWMGVLCI
jgi:hypothetical protein